MWSLCASASYNVQVSAPYRRVERNIAQYTGKLVFMERSLLSWRGLYNFGFLEVNFQLKYLCRFREMGGYFLCILVVVCHESSVASKREFAYQNISGPFLRTKIDWHWTGLSLVYSVSMLFDWNHWRHQRRP